MSANPFWPPAYEKDTRIRDFEETELYDRWYNRTQVGDPNDFIIAVSAASSTPVSGTGKSTLQATLGKRFDTSPGGFDAETKATLDVRELAYERLPQISNHSAVVADEIQGNPGTQGLDARRGMRQSVIDAINAITANRDKMLTVILGAQVLKVLDKRLYPIIDAWLLIWEAPSDPDGPLCGHYKLTTDDLNVTSSKWKTPRVESLTWDRLPHDDPDYAHLEKLKQEAKQRNSSDDEDDLADGELPKHIRDREIRELAKVGVKQGQLAERYGLKQPTISRIVNE